MREFDLLNHPLLAGTVSLIEASAGTGKTTAIENLFIRLLLEGLDRNGERIGLEVKQILVVTFTEAATAELVDRVRRNIFRAIELLNVNLVIDGVNYLEKTPDEIGDILIKLLVNYLSGPEEGDRQARKLRYALHLLHVALSDFDEAAISTIHGFCSRMLNEFAFESGVAFGAELIPDDRALVDEASADFWRRNFYADDAKLKCAVAGAGGLNPDELSRLAVNILKSPNIKLAGEENIPAFDSVYAALESAFQQLADFFVLRKAEIRRLLEDNIGIFKAEFRRELPESLRLLETGLENNDPVALVNGVGLFSTEIFVEEQQKKKVWNAGDGLMPAVIRELLEFTGMFQQAAADFRVCVKIGFIRHLRDSGDLKMKKRLLQVQSFDDLLSDMHYALEHQPSFAARIRQRFKVALIDEFQDTDPVQYAIFQRIFRDESTLMLMVGDPKQSIYAFRGADIFAYLQVADSMDDTCRTTLNKNFRSSRRLLEAFNAIFAAQNPFVEKDIKYLPAESGREPDRLVIDGEDIDASPMKLWLMEPGHDGNPVPGKKAADNLRLAVAAKIAWMLRLAGNKNPDGLPGARFQKTKADGSCDARPVKASDIAVLTDSNYEARQMREALADAGVPAVLQNSGNIFDTEEAAELYHVLRAAAEPGSDQLLRTALVTAMFGLNGADIANLEAVTGGDGETEIELWRRLFQEFNLLWREKGFVQMFFRMLRENPVHASRRLSVRENLLALPQGERHLTDLLHLGELLHQASRGGGLGLNGLIAWLHERILRPEENEEHEQRLESDDDAVKIMTVHKSKGLQFPIVFCPFMWNRGFYRKDENDFFFHELTPEGGYQQLFEAGYGDLEHNRIQCRREKLAESLRLLYVAMTRAKQFCCLAWGSIKNTEDSALMYLTRNWTDTDMQSYLALHGEGLIAGSGENFIKWAGNGAIRMEKPFAEQAHYEYERKPVALEAKHLRLAVPADWGIMSFSSISAGTHAGKDQAPGWDDTGTPVKTLEETVPLTGNEPESPFAGFPAGPVSGDCVHGIFEKFDFTMINKPGWRDLPEVKKLIKDNLLKFGLVEGSRDSSRFEESLNERSSQICGLLDNVLKTPLSAGEKTFRLSEIALRRRISEMEFFFHVSDPIRFDKLSELLQRKFYPEISLKLGYGGGKAPMRGFMNGKIDLFFEHGGKYWIIDWKTNWLGRPYSAYNQDALTADMIAKTYLMQASVYALAVDKYLKFRLPDYDYDRNFGGIFYLFVRGMDGCSTNQGAFKMRPEQSFIRELSEIFPGGAQ